VIAILRVRARKRVGIVDRLWGHGIAVQPPGANWTASIEAVEHPLQIQIVETDQTVDVLRSLGMVPGRKRTTKNSVTARHWYPRRGVR
jgi:hypothetical protein